MPWHHIHRINMIANLALPFTGCCLYPTFTAHKICNSSSKLVKPGWALVSATPMGFDTSYLVFCRALKP